MFLLSKIATANASMRYRRLISEARLVWLAIALQQRVRLSLSLFGR